MFAAVALALVAAAFVPAGSAKADCFDQAGMEAKVAASGLAWERRGPELWRVDMPSQSRDLVRVIAGCGQKVIPVFAVLAYSNDLRQSPELFMLLLRAAAHFDRVKVGVDSEGDYLVRIDLWPQTFDGAELAGAAEQIRQVVDQLTPPLRENHANR